MFPRRVMNCYKPGVVFSPPPVLFLPMSLCRDVKLDAHSISGVILPNATFPISHHSFFSFAYILHLSLSKRLHFALFMNFVNENEKCACWIVCRSSRVHVCANASYLSETARA